MPTGEPVHQCQTVNCGCLYEPDRGDRRGKLPKEILFKNLPEGWCYPACGAGKKMFRPLARPGSVKDEPV